MLHPWTGSTGLSWRLLTFVPHVHFQHPLYTNFEDPDNSCFPSAGAGWLTHSTCAAHNTDVFPLCRCSDRKPEAHGFLTPSHTPSGRWHRTDPASTVQHTFRGRGGAPQPRRPAPSAATRHDSLMTFSITNTATEDTMRQQKAKNYLARPFPVTHQTPHHTTLHEDW